LLKGGGFDETSRIVIVTHDCDIENEDHAIEGIVGRRLEAPDGNYKHAKNARRLHLAFSGGGADYWLELEPVNRIPIERALFATGDDDATYALDRRGTQTLKEWLASRYGRPAFPNEFVNRLNQSPGNGRKVSTKLERLLTTIHNDVVGVFFDLGEHRDAELEVDEPYILGIAIVYDSTTNGRQQCEEAADKVQQLFDEAYGPGGAAVGIALERCVATSDAQFTLLDVRRSDRWRIENLSVKDGVSTTDYYGDTSGL
jgi:hypothetical protein